MLTKRCVAVCSPRKLQLSVYLFPASLSIISGRQELNEQPAAGAQIGSCTKHQQGATTSPVAHQILERAFEQPNFKESELALISVVVTLVRKKNFVLVDNVVDGLKTRTSYLTPKLMSCLIRAYGEAKHPGKVEEVFYKMLEMNLKPSGPQLELILQILVKNDQRTAYDVFKEARRHGLVTTTGPYNILIRAFSRERRLSIACKLFCEMSKSGSLPDVESYRILIQGLCRRAQVKGAIGLLEDMFNKGLVPDSLIYSTLLNSLCRKKGKLGEAYKLLCRMEYKGCKPDVLHYNTVLLGFCRQGRASDACKIIGDMESSGCIPNVVTFRTLVSGLCDQGMLDEAKHYMIVMLSRGFSPHFSVAHSLIRELCNANKIDEACIVSLELLGHKEGLCWDTWMILITRICKADVMEKISGRLDKVMRLELEGNTRIVDAGVSLENYLREKPLKRWDHPCQRR